VLLANLLLGTLLVLSAILIPGGLLAFVRLVYRPADKRRLLPLDGVEWLTYSLAYGFGVVGSISFILVGFLGLFFRVFVTVWLLEAVAAAVSLAALARIVWVETAVRGRPVLELPAGLCRWKKAVATAPLAGWVVLAGAAVFLVYLVNYDRYNFEEERCLIRAAVLPVHNYLSTDTPMSWILPGEAIENNAFLHWNGGQRLGSAVFSGISLALFDFAGFRILHAFCGLFLLLGSFLAAREVSGRAGPALFAALALALSPYLLQIGTFDENLLAAATSALLLPMLMRKGRDVVGAAVLFALLLGIRPELLPWALVVPVFLRATAGSKEKRWADVTLFVVVALIFMSPCIYKHAREAAIYGIAYESFLSHPPVEHSFLGMTFEWRGLLNWPFVPAPVRPPFDAFPPALSFPLTVADRFGVLLTALALLGAAWNLLRRRWEAFLLLGLSAPLAAILALQSNWMEPAKMLVLVTVLVPFAVWIACGVAWLRDRGLREGLRYTCPLLALAVVWGGVRVCDGLGFQPDVRNLTYRKVYMAGFKRVMLDEQPEVVEMRRQQLVEANWLPSFRNVPLSQDLHLLARNVAHALQDLRQPSVTALEEPVANRFRRIGGFERLMHHPVTSMARGRPSADPKSQLRKVEESQYVDVVFDFSRSIAARADFVSVRRASAETPRLEPGRGVVVRAIPLPWAGRTGDFTLFADREGNVSALLTFEPPEEGPGGMLYGVPGAASDGFLPPGGRLPDREPPRDYSPASLMSGQPDTLATARLAPDLGPAAQMKPVASPQDPGGLVDLTWPPDQSPIIAIAMPALTIVELGEVLSFSPNLNLNWTFRVETPGMIKLAAPIPVGM
jgi:hypothetical protein